MKNLLSVLFFVLVAFTCNAQTTKSNSVIMELTEYTLTDVKKMSQSIGIYIDSIAYNGTASETNALALAKAANIGREKVKVLPSAEKRTIIIFFREEVMIGDY